MSLSARLVPAAVGPTLSSIGPLAFGPNGVLFAADPNAATIYAIDLGAASSAVKGTAALPKLDSDIAALLGTAPTEIRIVDLAVHPSSQNSFIAVMRGQGADAKPALVRVDGAGKLALVAMDTLTFTSMSLPNPAAVSPSGRGGRTQSVTDMAFVDAGDGGCRAARPARRHARGHDHVAEQGDEPGCVGTSIALQC